MDSDTNCIERKFAHGQIIWKIKNCCVMRNDKFRIDSPVFYLKGVHLTKWNLFINKTLDKENNAVYFGLKRLEDNTSVDVSVECEIAPSYSSWKNIKFAARFHENLECLWKIGSLPPCPVHDEKETDLDEPVCTSTPEHSIHSDDVYKFSCKIMVLFPNTEETFGTCNDLSLKRLSDDLFRMLQSEFGCDIEVQCRSGRFRFHKAILYVRINNCKIKEELLRSTTNSLDFRAFEDDAVKYVVLFLYTANMEYAVHSPSFSVYHFASFLDVPAITTYYKPEILTLCSTIEVEEFDLRWTIQNFSTKSEKSSYITNETGDTKWRLWIYEEKTGFDVYLVVEGKPRNACVRLDVETLSGNTFPSYHALTENEKVLLLGSYTKKMIDDCNISFERLTFLFKLRIPTDSQSEYIETSIVTCEPYSKQLNYAHLSNAMSSLVTIPDLCCRSILVHLQGLTSPPCQFLVYDRIICFRHDSFGYQFVSTGHVFSDITSEIFTEFLSYLYCGKINFRSLDEFFKLFSIALKYGLGTLKHELVIRLHSILIR